MEFLTETVLTIPSGTEPQRVEELRLAESVRTAELAAENHLIRIWRPVTEIGQWKNIGLWRAANETELRNILSTLPLFPWMTISMRLLLPHPNDPGSISPSAGPKEGFEDQLSNKEVQT